MPTFTLSLDADSAARIRTLLDTFGGTVPSFAASLAKDFSKLPPEEIVRIRKEVTERIRTYEIAAQIHSGRKPQ